MAEISVAEKIAPILRREADVKEMKRLMDKYLVKQVVGDDKN